MEIRFGADTFTTTEKKYSAKRWTLLFRLNINNMSKKYRLNKADGLKILKGACYAGGGGVCAYLITVLPNLDFGPQTILITAIASVLLNAGVKFFQGK